VVPEQNPQGVAHDGNLFRQGSLQAGALLAPDGTMNDVSRPSDYEKSDADPRLIGALALGIAIFLAATPFLLRAGYPAAERADSIAGPLPLPPEPRLQVGPKADLERVRAYERGRLETFGWTDRDRQIARIPIERAMQLLAERGIAGWPAQTAQPPSR
jgi:hypothetical protein